MYVSSVMLIIAGSFTLALVVLPIVIIRIFIGEINFISDSIYKMSLGDLTHKLEVKEKSIFKNLYKNINLFIVTIRKLINESTNMTDKLIDYCEDLENDAIIVKKSSDEACIAIDGISAETASQLKDTFNAESLINEIVEEHQAVIKNAQNIDRLAGSTMKFIEQGNTVYSELKLKLENSAESNLNLVNKVSALNDKAYKIQKIADGVGEISKNTNLLSLNASIEAARSTSGTNGFSVVANEIGKLAQTSSKQADEIQIIINDIKDEILEISEWMEKEVERIRENIHFSDITKDNLDKISDESNNTLESVVDINKIISSQSSKITEIKQLIKDVCSLSQHTVSQTEKVNISSRSQLGAVENTLDSIYKLNTMNKNLKSSISSFAKNYEVTSSKKEYIEKGLKTLRNLSKNEIFLTMDYKKCTGVLKEAIKEYPEFDLFALMQQNGLRKAITLDYTEEQTYVNFFHRPYFKASVHHGLDYQSEPYISDDTYNYCIAITVPIRNKKGEAVGLLIGDLILG